jgi:hypothetical protein
VHAGTGSCIAQEAQANRGRVSAFRLDVRGCREARCCRCGEMRKVTANSGSPYRVQTLPAFATLPTSLLVRCRGASLGEEETLNVQRFEHGRARMQDSVPKVANSLDACQARLRLADPALHWYIYRNTQVPHQIHRLARLKKCYLQPKYTRRHPYETEQKKGQNNQTLDCSKRDVFQRCSNLRSG